VAKLHRLVGQHPVGLLGACRGARGDDVGQAGRGLGGRAALSPPAHDPGGQTILQLTEWHAQSHPRFASVASVRGIHPWGARYRGALMSLNAASTFDPVARANA
jgi:hypothetical protein